MDLWRIVWFILAVVIIAFLVFGCQTIPEPQPTAEELIDPCATIPGYESERWADGHAWNSAETGCL